MEYFYWSFTRLFYVRVYRTREGATVVRKFLLQNGGTFTNEGFGEFAIGKDPSEHPQRPTIREMTPTEIAQLRLQYNELLEDDKKYRCA